MKASRRRPVVIRNRYFVVSDLLLIALAATLGLAIRLEFPSFWSYLAPCVVFVLLAEGTKLPVYYLFQLYRRYWRYASTSEMLSIVGATAAASILLSALALGIFRPLDWLPDFPGSALIIDWLLNLLFIGGVRFLVRVFGESSILHGNGARPPTAKKASRVLVVGAGEAGAMIVREMRNNPGVGMEPVGYVDDNRAKIGMRIRDLPVLGTRESIPDLVRKLQVDEVLIAMPTATGLAIRQIKEICESIRVPFKTIPGMYELLDGRLEVSQIRDVQIEDLLRRDPVRIRADDALYLHDKVVLVTGAGGSIGAELCRQVGHQQPREIVLLGHGENSIYLVHQELEEIFPSLKLTPAIADVRDKARLQRIVQTHHPQVVFHTAAHKHVPLMEQNAEDAVTNNVLGTRNMLEVAEEFDLQRFVLISTDKAVNPANIMGATKRIAELLVQDAARRTGQNYVAVRFGNVLGSRGSVVPKFKHQIAVGGPVTVTHPQMERYFMTIPEAVYLVLQAAAFGVGGELFVLDMGEPIRIIDLARDLITLSGLHPDRDIEIRYTGARPGEKLRERLFLEGEDYETTGHDKILVFKQTPPLAGDALTQAVQRLIALAQQGAAKGEMVAAIKAIVPDLDIVPGTPHAGSFAAPRPDAELGMPSSSAV